jgi:anaerobic dimethyl sulfoxide reductase subunit A
LNFNFENVTQKRFSRRDFIGTLSTAAVSLAVLSSCKSNAENELTATEITATIGEVDQALARGEGEWVPVACWHDCGGRCKNYALVLDGVIVRQKSDDSHEDSLDYPQLRGCIRGRSQRKQCLGVDRLRYPMKRKNWQPGGGEASSGHLRGKDEWERITWDEALSLMAGELLRVSEGFGPEAIMTYKKDSPSLNAIGGCTKIFDTRSFGVFYQNMNYLGMPAGIIQAGNDRYDLPNADIVVLYSNNIAWTATGFPAWLVSKAKEQGVSFVAVGPEYNVTAQMLDADWMPVRNGTDIAFLLGVAYEMMRLEKEEGGIIDRDFLNTYCVGYDKEHMPEDAVLNENFSDYIFGEYDGTPKTPAWASKICGAPEEKITSFARTMGKKNNVMFGFGLASGRTVGSESLPQLMMTICCMGGHIGKRGNCISLWEHPQAGNFGEKLIIGGNAAMPRTMNNVEHYVPAPLAWDLVASGGGSYPKVHPNYGMGMMLPAQEMVLPEIKGIMHIVGNNLQNMTNLKKGIEAHRKVDFVFTRAHFFNADAQYSDIVLPLTTKWEEPGIIIYDGQEEEASRENLFCFKQVMDPLYESRSDQEIEEGLLEAMGFDPKEFFPKTEKQKFFEEICGSTVMNKSKEYEPLVTVTQEDIEKWGFPAEEQNGRLSIDELIKNGGYQVERSSGDVFGNIGFKSFIDSPESNPLPSNSGKFEIYCQAKADTFNSWYQDGIVFKPYPAYLVPLSGYESTFENNDIEGQKSEYPYTLFTVHYMRRTHGIFDNIPWLRKAWVNPVFLNTSDAKVSGIETGDTVLITTPHGKVLRKASLLDTLMPGVVSLPHGSWPRIDEEKEIDRGGCDNYLTGAIHDRSIFGAFNSLICSIEKYNEIVLEDDVDVEQAIFDFEK